MEEKENYHWLLVNHATCSPVVLNLLLANGRVRSSAVVGPAGDVRVRFTTGASPASFASGKDSTTGEPFLSFASGI